MMVATEWQCWDATVASAGSARKEALERKYQDCSIMKKVFLPIGNGGGWMVA